MVGEFNDERTFNRWKKFLLLQIIDIENIQKVVHLIFYV